MEKYTIIIPTRDRAETLEATIRTCLRQTYGNFEVIVSDNQSDDNTKEVVRRFDDSRIKYINTGKRLSMAGNFEFSLAHVTEGFVMFIGSDDGVIPGAIEYVDSIAKKYSVDAVSCTQAAYVWPNFFDKEKAGCLTISGARYDVEIRHSHEWIERTLNFESPYCFGLPNLYCGFVKHEVIRRAYTDGTYFKSITPDAYSAFATAIFIDRYAFSHKPFVIAGASSKSNGASGMNPASDDKEANRFYSEDDIALSKGFVACPSYEVTCAETFAKLAEFFPDLCSGYKINYNEMLSKSIRNANSKTRPMVMNAVEKMAKNFTVDLNASGNNGSIKLRNILIGLKSGLHLLANHAGIMEIKRSNKYGIIDVDDAAVVAGILLAQANNTDFISRLSYLLSRTINRF